MVYDVYYTTGGGPWVNTGSDIWVNLWIELIAPKLDIKPILLIHRNKPKGHEDYEFPIETYWHGEDIQKFEKKLAEIMANAKSVDFKEDQIKDCDCNQCKEAKLNI